MRLGIMGGTFDPIHLGHLAIGRAAYDEMNLDKVLFLPDGDPPHKTPRIPASLRFHLVQLAIRGQKGFYASDMELARTGRTYTVDTLLHLKQHMPGEDLFYIIGSDTLYQFPTWRTAEKVAELCRMLVVMRPGDEEAAVRVEQQRLWSRYALSSTLLAFRGLDISSSCIRQAVSAGKPYSQWVPEAVAEFIRKEGLYQGKWGRL